MSLAMGVQTCEITANWRGRSVLYGFLAVGLAIAAAIMIGQARAGSGVTLEREDASAVLAWMNETRALHGTPRVASDARLVRAAEAYARDLAARGTLAHVARDGSLADARAESEGYEGWSVIAENLASGRGDVDAQSAVEAWMRSASHRANILAPDVGEAGAGCASAHGRWWCVLVFGSRD